MAHHRGDMRTVRLGTVFDGVLIHDAVSYMLTEEDLRAAFATARAHLRPGGLLRVAPDLVRENFRDGMVLRWPVPPPTTPDGIAVEVEERIVYPDPTGTVIESVITYTITEGGITAGRDRCPPRRALPHRHLGAPDGGIRLPHPGYPRTGTRRRLQGASVLRNPATRTGVTPAWFPESLFRSCFARPFAAPGLDLSQARRILVGNRGAPRGVSNRAVVKGDRHRFVYVAAYTLKLRAARASGTRGEGGKQS